MSATQNLVSLRITENIATGKDDTKDLVAAINNGWDRLHFSKRREQFNYNDAPMTFKYKCFVLTVSPFLDTPEVSGSR